ncbi:hypothetical protein CPSG_07326 [Coccidioides posadasii str. Silveira]|uniref:Uncharacterized protein n=1 Tax=Coccidioides posadasii (strain RMSCC 757 / Silveira) TaxID=443226 RepID=E9DBX4_COCPS|nr:hypothetical protein CPSG_07326 [Coccidioides posadasii str. Silveira]
MPYATHWVCCRCKFGPMSIENYPACINCQHRGAKSPCCHHECLRDHDSYHYAAEMSSYAAQREPEFDNPAVISIPQMSHDRRYFRAAPTYLYVCCGCGDGPKVYQLEPRCVNCSHDACPYCRYVK